MIGTITFNIDNVDHTLRFGMLSAEIFAEQGVKEVVINAPEIVDGDAGDVTEFKHKASNTKTLAVIIYAGLCNHAEVMEAKYPTFQFAYDLMESVCMTGPDLQNEIFATWEKSRPTVQMFERLNDAIDELKKKMNKPASSSTPSKGTKRIGTKSKRSHLA